MFHKKKKVLFVCYGAGHVNMLLPVIKKSLKNDNLIVTVLGLTTAGKVLDNNGVQYLGFRDFVEPGDECVKAFGDKLASEMPRNGDVSLEETRAYLGLNYRDLVKQYGPDVAEDLYRNKGRQAFLPLFVMRKVFDQIGPDILVSTNSPRSERAAFMVARERHIPGICIVGLFAHHEIEWIGEHNFASKVCVISDGVKRFIESAGRRHDEVIVTGNPALDRLARSGLEDESAQFRCKNGWKGKKVILWASQPEPAVHPFTGAAGDPTLPRRVDQVLLDIVAKHENWHLVIRHHPGEILSPEDLPSEAQISTKEDDLAILLKSVDVVITMTSTVGLEGVLLGKPLITVNESVFHEDAPYEKMGLAKGVSQLEDLEAALSEILSGHWSLTEPLPEVGEATGKVFSQMKELLLEQ